MRIPANGAKRKLIPLLPIFNVPISMGGEGRARDLIRKMRLLCVGLSDFPADAMVTFKVIQTSIEISFSKDSGKKDLTHLSSGRTHRKRSTRS